MNAVLRAMLEGVIDYAGLFPPAKLSMEDAVREYCALVEGPNSWIVDRFACSASQLPLLAQTLAKQDEVHSIPVSVIGTPSADRTNWKGTMERDAALMTDFMREAEGRADIQAYEVRVPDHTGIERYVTDLRQFTGVDVFVELPWTDGMHDSLAAIAELETAFAKVRTGGLDAAAFPSNAVLASFIQQCSQLDLTFKMTAGLHHPLPTKDSATGATMHGFLNVLCATALSLANELSIKEIETVLEETDAKVFSFKRDSVTVHEHRATLEEVENSRTLFVSFGSCSVEEPLQDLASAGFLGKVSR